MEATLIYPHQLFKSSPALRKKRPVYLVEESLLLTYNPIHRQKLIFHKLTLDAHQADLEARGYQVTRLTIHEYPETALVFGKLVADGITKIHVIDTTDSYLEAALAESGLERIWHESPLFILEKADAIERYRSSKRRLAAFYKKLRQDKNILITDTGEPVGGKWSFDAENRKKLPKTIELPDDIAHFSHTEISAAATWAETVPAEKYGEPGCWLPYTRADAQKFLAEFLQDRFAQFGPYEDALSTAHTRLFHSTLSPLLNVGLLTPQAILDAAITHSQNFAVPINSLEGFVRQILGWREFIRASYECDGDRMRSQNFWNHSRPLPESFWTGTTYITPVDHAVHTALQYSYNHHIERLMVLGNFMLLNQINPDEVYRWFMGLYVDAYDWVMVPNVYGMSQFADGGSFATKPYISGSNYIKKMSHFKTGEWEETWTALYWNFISTNIDFFNSNHRLVMMPRLWEKMEPEKQNQLLEVARQYLEKG